MTKIKVWDAAVRIGHWAMGALVLGAFLTAEQDDWTSVHTRLGLVLLGIVVFRLVWGVVGSKHARFKDFVRSPRTVLAYARQYVRGKPPHVLGHNPLGAVMVLALLATLLVATLSGVAMYLGPEWDGPFAALISHDLAEGLEEVHEVSTNLVIPLVILHVLGVIVSSVNERQNLIAGMITGLKRHVPEASPKTAEIRHPVPGFIVAVLLGALTIFAIWRLMPTAEAATPQTPLLAQYAAEARRGDPAFTAFDPAAGEALYYSEHPGSSGPVSCATCHNRDPRTEGRSPAGKRVQPLAPSANPERFTNRKTADKWFDRNCKQVIGRVCTAREKGDVLAWLVTR